MQTVTLTKIYRDIKQGPKGPYTSLQIYTKEHPEQKLTGFGNKENESWTEGMQVQIEIEQKGKYLNFKTPFPGGRAPSKTWDKLSELEERIDHLEKGMKLLKEFLKQKFPEKASAPTPKVEESAPDDLPF